MKLLNLLTILILCFSLIFIGCDEELSGPVEYEDSKTTTTLKIDITDTRTNAPIDSVLVNINDSGSVYTDTSGLAKLTDLSAGTYQIVCEKKGYETITFMQILAMENSSVPILPKIFKSITMTKKGVTISGTVYYDSKTTTRGFKLADSAIVECMLPDNLNYKTIYKSVYTSLTGVFTFDSLPEHTNYTLTVKPYRKNSKQFRTAAAINIPNNGSFSAGDTVTVAPINLYESVDNFQIVSHNLDTMGISDSGRIEFSEAVNLSILTPDSIYLTDVNNRRIPARYIWSPATSSTILQTVPFDSTWDKTQNYRLHIRNIKSATGKVLLKGTPGSGWDNTNSYYQFSLPMKGTLTNITSLKFCINGDTLQKADYNEAAITLFWPALASAKNYQVYKKGLREMQWTEVAGSPVTDTAIDVTTTNWFNNGDSTMFFVIGANAQTTSPIASAVKLSVKDEKKPKVKTGDDLDLDSLAGFDNLLVAVPDTILSDSIITLSEPMDTTKKPVITTTQIGGTAYVVPAGNCMWVWSNETTGRLQVIVDASQNGSGDLISVNFKVCADKAGNLFDSTNTTGLGIQYYITKP